MDQAGCCVLTRWAAHIQGHIPVVDTAGLHIYRHRLVSTFVLFRWRSQLWMLPWHVPPAASAAVNTTAAACDAAAPFLPKLLQLLLLLLLLSLTRQQLCPTCRGWLQACASTAIINFAPVVLRKLHGVEAGHAVLYSALISASKTVGVLLGW
jgi:hypothetical protein